MSSDIQFQRKDDSLESVWESVKEINVNEYLEGRSLSSSSLEQLSTVSKVLLSVDIRDDERFSEGENVKRLEQLSRVLQVCLEYQAEKHEVQAMDNEVKMDELAQDLKDAMRQEEVLSKRLEEMEEELSSARGIGQASMDDSEVRTRLDEAERELEEERSTLARLERELRDARDSIDTEKERNEELLSAATKTRAERKEAKDALDEAQDEIRELRAELQHEHERSIRDGVGDLKLEQQLKQKAKDVDRLTKGNRDLERALHDARKKNEELRGELLQMDENLVSMYDESKDWKVSKDDMEAAVEQLARERSELAGQVAELDRQVGERMSLLDAFETKFGEQYRAWEDQLTKLAADLENAERTRPAVGPNSPPGAGPLADPSAGPENPRASLGGGGGGGAAAQELKEQLRHMQEKEVLLLEAYEQLERDVGSEVDRALEKQRTYIGQLEAEAVRREEIFEQERSRFSTLDRTLVDAQRELEDSRAQMARYEEGYGLPDAMRDVKDLKRRLREAQDEYHRKVMEYNRQSERLEDVVEENREMRRQLGLNEDSVLDLVGDVKLRSQVEIAQLRALNSGLEREIADLEEDRRRLRMEMRFRAKWQGEAAAKMGLTHAQLLLLEEYAEQLRYGSLPASDPATRAGQREGTVVQQLEAHVQQLEARVAKLMAASDLAPDELARLLGDFDAGALAAGAGAADAGGAVLAGSSRQALDNLRAASTKLAVENRELRDRLDAAAAVLRELVDGGGDLGPGKEVPRALEHLMGPVGGGAGPAGAGGVGPGAGGASAAAPQHTHAGEERSARGRARIEALERAVSAGGAEVAEQIRAVAREIDESHKAIARLEGDCDALRQQMRAQAASQYASGGAAGGGMHAHLAGSITELGASAASFGGGGRDGGMVPRSELHATSVQLLDVLAEHARREEQLTGVGRDMELYRGQMKGLFHQRQLLYRDYLRSRDDAKVEADQMAARIRRLEGELQERETAAREHERSLEAFKGGPDELKKQLAGAVGRLTVTQVKQVRLQRALDSALSSEAALREEKESLSADLSEMGATLQARHSHMEKAQQQAQLRLQRLFRKLEDSVPAHVYNALAEKHAEVSKRYRRAMEDRTDAIVTDVEATSHRDRATQLAAEVTLLKEENETLGEQCKQLARELAEDAAGDPEGMEAKLREEVVSLRVGEANARRRQELTAKDLGRAEEGKKAMEGRVQELEAQVEKQTASLHAAQEAERDYTRRLDAAVERERFQEQSRALDAAEARAARYQGEASDARRAQGEAEGKLSKTRADRHLTHGELNGLRAALREMQLPNDAAAQMGRLHEETLRLRGEQVQLKHRMGSLEDEADRAEADARRLRAEMEDREKRIYELESAAAARGQGQREAVQRMEEALSGRIDSSKAEKWGRALEDLKRRNDALQGSTEAGSRREADLEERLAATEARLQHAGDVSRMVGGTVPDAIRENVDLAEDNLRLRLAETRLQREASTWRGKAELLERQRAQVEAQLQGLEEEAMKKESDLRAAADRAARRADSLEQELAEAQRELGALSAVADPAAFRRSRRSADGPMRAAAGGGEPDPGREREREREASRRTRMGQRLQQDQDILLEQIERMTSLKHELQDASERAAKAEGGLLERTAALEMMALERDALLARLESQAARGLRDAGGSDAAADETAAEHVKAVAQATIQRLQELVDEKNDALEAARRAAAAQRKEAAAAEGQLREEIERLNQLMYERNDAHIKGLKRQLAEAGRVIAGDPQSVYSEMSFDQIRDVLGEREQQIEVLHNRIEQAGAKYDILEARFQEQLAAKQGEVEAALQEADRERSRGPTRMMENLVSKLKSQLNVKDGKLRQLKEAIKQLEGRLVAAMQANADGAMAGAAGQRSDSESKRADALASEVDSLRKKLEASRGEAVKLREREDAMRRDRQGLERRAHDAEAKLARQSEELTRERRLARGLKNQSDLARESAEQLLTTIPPDPRIGEMERRVLTLEAQNAKLKRSLREAESGGDGREVERFSPGRGGGGGGGGGVGAGRPAPGGAAPAPRRAGGSMLAGDPALERWEEGKKLQKRAEVLKGRLDAARKQLEDAERAAARAGEREDAAAREVDKLRARVRALERDAEGKSKGPRPDTERVRSLAEKLEAAEAERDRLQKAVDVDLPKEVSRAELERDALRRELEALKAGGGPEGGGAREAWSETDAGARERRELEEKLLERDHAVLEARLEARQARSQATALSSRIRDLFDEEAAAAEKLGKWAERRGGGAPPRRGGQTTREVELEGVVEALKKVVAKMSGEKEALQRSAGSNQKYVEVSHKNKELRRQLKEREEAAARADELRGQLGEVSGRYAQAQAQCNNLEKQLKAEKKRAAAAAASASSREVSASGGPGVAPGLAEELRMEAAAKAQVIDDLRRELKEREGELAAASRVGGGDGSEVRALREEVRRTRAEAGTLAAENRDLKTELNAFDPEFFQEIEQMKYEHHTMKQELARYRGGGGGGGGGGGSAGPVPAT